MERLKKDHTNRTPFFKTYNRSKPTNKTLSLNAKLTFLNGGCALAVVVMHVFDMHQPGFFQWFEQYT